MSNLKFGLVACAIVLFSLPSITNAQGFTQRGTRNGAIAGAIIGGIVGDQNNEALAGAAIGGLVGGVTGRAIGRSQDAQYWNGYTHGSGYYNTSNVYYHQPAPAYYGNTYRVQYVPVVPVTPVYHGGYGGRVYYGRGGGYYGGGCRRW